LPQTRYVIPLIPKVKLTIFSSWWNASNVPGKKAEGLT
jgi:hypothetical protein